MQIATRNDARTSEKIIRPKEMGPLYVVLGTFDDSGDLVGANVRGPVFVWGWVGGWVVDIVGAIVATLLPFTVPSIVSFFFHHHPDATVHRSDCHSCSPDITASTSELQ